MGKERENIMPGEQTLNGVELNVAKNPILDAIEKDSGFDPEIISQSIARMCEPGDRLYKRDASLKKDPFKAIAEVKIHGIDESEIKDPVEGLLIGAAKLETAKKELNLAPKQKEAFDGVLENIHGAIAWARGAAEDARDYVIANKVVRKTLIGAQVVGLTLTSAGCVNAVKTPDVAFTQTPVPAETFTPTPTETLPTPTTVIATPTETATLSVEQQNKNEIVTNINNFLTAEGEFSDEKLVGQLFVYDDPNRTRNEDLGLFLLSPNIANIQGLILGSVQKENDVWVFLGTKFGNDAQRVVIPFRIPLENIEHRPGIAILFHSTKYLAAPGNYLDTEKTIYMKTGEQINTELNQLLFKPVLIPLFYNITSNYEEVKEYTLSIGGSETDAEFVYKMWQDINQNSLSSYCSFYPVDKTYKSRMACGGYEGVKITTVVSSFDEKWLEDSNFLSTTQFYRY